MCSGLRIWTSIATGVGLLVAAAVVAPKPAGAADGAIFITQVDDHDPFTALVGKKRKRYKDRTRRSTAQHYALATDDRAFLFEDMGAQARISFLCTASDPRLECSFEPRGTAAEIHALTPTRGPRGDVIFKNARGEALLRIASYGGATVYWPGESEGKAASKSYGEEKSLHLSYIDPQTAHRRARTATAAISAITGAPIIFEIDDPATDEVIGAAVLADAIVVAAKGIAAVSGDPTGAQVVSGRIEVVHFVPDGTAQLILNQKVLEVRYNPSLDVQGRPSSAEIVLFLEESL